MVEKSKNNKSGAIPSNETDKVMDKLTRSLDRILVEEYVECINFSMVSKYNKLEIEHNWNTFDNSKLSKKVEKRVNEIFDAFTKDIHNLENKYNSKIKEIFGTRGGKEWSTCTVLGRKTIKLSHYSW